MPVVTLAILPEQEGAFTKNNLAAMNKAIGDANANFTLLNSITSAVTVTDALTATPGGGSAGALLLPSVVNRITIVATVGDSVKLPVSAGGKTVYVINSGAFPMNVFPTGADTINDIGVVPQVANSIEIYVSPVAGKWYVDAGLGFAGGLSTDGTTDALTAFAGGGQASATPLLTQFSRVTTVATVGDSVKLPAAAVGLDLIVTNHGAASMTVWPSGADTIDDAGSVDQMLGSVVLYVCFTAGKWYANGVGTGFAGSLPTVSFQNNITATAAGTQGTAFQLKTAINRMTVVATAGDAVKLPASSGGLQIYTANGGATAMNVFPLLGDQINALGVNVAFSVPVTKTASFICAAPGFWHAILSA